jgi:hypothetical protein
VGLRKEHLEQLSQSGIESAMAERWGVSSVTHEEALELGFMGQGSLAGLYFPYYDPKLGQFIRTGRLRLDEPFMDGPKYLAQKGSGNKPYMPAPLKDSKWYHRVANDKSIPLWIVEGEKKALKLAQHVENDCVIGIGGCNNWSEPRTEEEKDAKKRRQLLPILRHFCQGRTVYIGFDSDVLDNDDVYNAERALVGAVFDAGGRPRPVSIPPSPGPGAGKQGLDDYLAAFGVDAYGAVVDLKRGALRARRERLRVWESGHLSTSSFEAKKLLVGDAQYPILIAPGTLFIHAGTGVGKSYLALQLAHCLATGKDFLGYEVPEARRVLYLQAELDDPEWQGRVWTMNKSLGEPPTESLYFVNGAFNLSAVRSVSESGFVFNKGVQDFDFTKLEQVYSRVFPDVVFFDPLQFYIDFEENSNSMAREFMKQVVNWGRRKRCAVVFIHHDRKSQDGESIYHLRGGSAWSDLTETIIGVKRQEIEPKNEEEAKRLKKLRSKVYHPSKVEIYFEKFRHANAAAPPPLKLDRNDSPFFTREAVLDDTPF